MWMTLLGVKILKMRKRTRVMLRNTMMRVEAPLAIPPVTAFTSAAIVGTGLGVGVVGGGTGGYVHQKIVCRDILIISRSNFLDYYLETIFPIIQD